MYKKITLLAILVLINCSNVFSQLRVKQNNMFPYEGKTLIVVVDDAKMYDPVFQEVFKAEWKLTPYEIVSNSQVVKDIKKYSKEDNLYLVFQSYIKSYSHTQFGTGVSARKVDALGGLVAIRLHYYIQLQFDQYNFHESDLTKLLRNYQGFLNVDKEGNLALPSPKIKSQTLLISEAFTWAGDITRSDIEKVYKSPFEIVGASEIEKAINSKRKGVYLLDIGSLSYYVITNKDSGDVGYSLFLISSLEDNSIAYFYEVGGARLSKKKFLKQLESIQAKLDKQK